jgi:DNA-binding ferritin-like protein
VKIASKRRLIRAFYEGEGSLDKVRLVEAHMQRMLAVLRAQSWLYQTAHWQVAGMGFYGDHLLFQRLYETVQGEIDAIAEKIVGYVGRDGVDAMESLTTTAQYIAYWAQDHDPYKRALQSEEMFQRAFKEGYDALKDADALTLGLDDWIMATASTHEAHTYLLQQRIADELRGVTAAAVESGAAAPSAEGHFFDNPEKREVRELATSKAVSNDPAVAETSKQEEDGTKSEVRQEVQRAEAAPPTPSDIKDQPGGKDFSTLNRFVVTTEESVKGVPDGHDEVDKHPPVTAANKLAARWLTTTGNP